MSSNALVRTVNDREVVPTARSGSRVEELIARSSAAVSAAASASTSRASSRASSHASSRAPAHMVHHLVDSDDDEEFEVPLEEQLAALRRSEMAAAEAACYLPARTPGTKVRVDGSVRSGTRMPGTETEGKDVDRRTTHTCEASSVYVEEVVELVEFLLGSAADEVRAVANYYMNVPDFKTAIGKLRFCGSDGNVKKTATAKALIPLILREQLKELGLVARVPVEAKRK